jgi:two-component system LytT family sensor kinase
MGKFVEPQASGLIEPLVPPGGSGRREGSRGGATPATGAFALLWLAVGVISLVAGVAQARVAGIAVPWGRVISDALGWLTWVALVPVAIWSTARFPLDGKDGGRPATTLSFRLAVHLTLSLAVALIYASLSALRAKLVLGLSSGEWSWSFSDLLPGYLFGGLPLYVVVYAVLVMGAHAGRTARLLKEGEAAAAQLEARLAEARLEALKMQLDPHFLFNALNGVAAQMRAEPRAAEKTLLRLSEFLRVTLRDAARQEVPLADELKFLDAYVAVERARFGEALSVEVDVPEEAKAIRVPSLLLQPLVENAVRHGMRSQGLAVRVTARLSEDRLELSVIDDGRGLRDSTASSGAANTPGGAGTAGTAGEGVGLRNSRARLRELYGERGRLELQARTGGGVEVHVTVPRAGGRP